MIRTSAHMVKQSPWPFYSSLSVGGTVVSILFLLRGVGSLWALMFCSLSLSVCIFGWFRDISREASIFGDHTELVVRGIKLGMCLFIFSEVMFFVGFFWAFFHCSLSPSAFALGCKFPPKGITPISPSGVPLSGTVVLLYSGLAITMAHKGLVSCDKLTGIFWLFLTIVLGCVFSYLQYSEYCESSFCMSDGVYGSLFYTITGFHGVHVLIGTSILFVVFIRLLFDQMSSTRHVGFELAAWYWHFVDVVWLLVYFFIYCWGYHHPIEIHLTLFQEGLVYFYFWLGIVAVNNYMESNY